MSHYSPAATALRQAEQEPTKEELSNGSQANLKAHQPFILWCLFLLFHLEMPTEGQAGSGTGMHGEAMDLSRR